VKSAIERNNECLAELQKRALRFNAPDSLTVIQSNDIQLKPIPSGSADFFFAFDVLLHIDEWPPLCSRLEGWAEENMKAKVLPGMSREGMIILDTMKRIIDHYLKEWKQQKDRNCDSVKVFL